MNENKCGTTPKSITRLADNEVFIFGSNEGGHHGKGAALDAKLYFGAKNGVGFGLQGKSFGIPTKSADYRYSLSISKIRTYVDKFREFVLENPELHFLITKIGTNLAGFTIAEIKPLFKEFKQISNCSLPKEFQ